METRDGLGHAGTGFAFPARMVGIHDEPCRNGRRRRNDGESTGPRFLLYSHDSAGLGHLRRNLTLAAALVKVFPKGMVVLATGSPCATTFPLAPRVDLIKLPSIGKDDAGSYVPRSLPTSLSFVLRMRRALLLETMRTFDPDLLLVDHQVIGLHGEVLPLLETARARGVKTVFGMRDVVDAPEVVACDWAGDDCRWALAEGYDRICVYGAPRVFDPRREYPFPPELSERIQFTGYVVRETAPLSPEPIPSLRPEVLVTMGGGEDGAERIETYLAAIERERPRWDSVIVTGPLLSGKEMRRLARRARLTGHARVHRFHADLPRLLHRAHAVVSMAGYNTCAEILSARKRAVLLPRTYPRLEQSIRAERLAALGLARSLRDFDAERLRNELEVTFEHDGPLSPPPPLDGAERIAAIASNLLGVPARDVSRGFVETLAQ